MDQKGEVDPRSVFVRNISYDVEDAELTEVFSALGPVRHAFLIRDGKGGRHKGFGIVQYALEEDAERAVQELHGSALGGRKIKVEAAKKRAPLEERKGKRKQSKDVGEDGEQAEQPEHEPANDEEAAAEPAAKKPRSAAAKGPEKKERKPKDPEALAQTAVKHALVRTVAVGGLSAETVDAAMAFAKEKGGEAVEAIINPAPEDLVRKFKLSLDGCSGEVIFIRYTTAKDAMAAIASLHGQHVSVGEKKKKGKNKGPEVQLWARQVSGEGLHLKRWRLVVRNLSFKATEADLRAAFESAGFLWEVTFPRKPDGQPRGFAFVGFTSRAHAERGIKAVNGTKIAGRPVAVDWAVAKRDYEQGASPAAPAAVSDSDAEESDGDELSDSDYEDGKKRKPRGPVGEQLRDEDVPEMAPEEERGMLHSVIGDILGEDSDDEDEDMDEKEAEFDEESEEDEEEEVAEGTESENESEDDSDFSEEEEDEGSSDDEEMEDAEPGAAAANEDMFGKKARAAAEGQANAAVERVERRAEQLAAALENGGKRPGPPPGAAVFVRGLALDITKDQLYTSMRAFGPVASARLVVDKVTGKAKGTAFVDFWKEDAASAAVAACEKGRQKTGPGVLVAGKKVDVDLALDSDGARKLAAEKGPGEGKDRRNLYLGKEGTIPEGSAAWEELSASDKAKRKRAAEEARTKLRSPNFCISKTRLNVRNVPRGWDEKKLKALCIKAVKERATKANPKVVQVKILREDGADGSKGTGRSKGIAFVEFGDHEHALCALRQLNNNPSPWGKEARPIVEFAIDDVRALKKREARNNAPPKAAGAAGGGGGDNDAGKSSKKSKKKAPEKDSGDEEDGKSKSKRKLRAERRRMLKERQRAAQNKPATEAKPAAAAAANGALTKAQRRREQRKRNQGGDNGDAPTKVVKIPSKSEVANAKAAKVQQQKERGDALVDRLASAGVKEGRVVKKRRRDTDRVERLAEAYVARTYGDAPKKSKAAGQQAKAEKKRWFQD